MSGWGRAAVAAVGIGAAAAALQRWRRRSLLSLVLPDGATDPHRVRVLTVDQPVDQVDPLPVPLAPFGDAIEVVTRPAPGDRGTEIAVRIVDPRAASFGGEDPVRAVRQALRETKQLSEVGWVLSPDAHAEGEHTALNAPLRALMGRSRKEGRL